MPVRVLITAGTVADCIQASTLIDGLDAKHLLADRGYDTDTIIDKAAAQQMNVVIPPKKHRIQQRQYDKALYRSSSLSGNAFLHLKQ